MNLILFSHTDRLDNGQVRLIDERLLHLQSVLGAAEGDTVRVGEINGRQGTGCIEQLTPGEALLTVELSQPPPEKLPLVLLLALPRPKQLRRILRSVGELGIPELHLINSYRVEKSYWQTPVLDDSTVEDYFLQGLSQARDTVLPRLHLHRRFKPFVEDELPALIGERRALVGHPGDFPPITAAVDNSARPSLLAIGPEGGFIPYEVEKLIEAGCTPCSLGPRILRVENAVIAAVSRLF